MNPTKLFFAFCFLSSCTFFKFERFLLLSFLLLLLLLLLLLPLLFRLSLYFIFSDWPQFDTHFKTRLLSGREKMGKD